MLLVWSRTRCTTTLWAPPVSSRVVAFSCGSVSSDDLTFANERFLSMYRMIELRWVIRGEFLILETDVPPNATAEMVLPSEKQSPVW